MAPAASLSSLPLLAWILRNPAVCAVKNLGYPFKPLILSQIVLWSLDLLLSCVTGFYHEGAPVQSQPRVFLQYTHRAGWSILSSKSGANSE